MQDYLQIMPEHNGAGPTLHVSGELDIASAPFLQTVVDDVSDGVDEDVCLDMARLTFMDSTGAHALLHIHNAIGARGRRVVFKVPGGRVPDVLEILGLDQVLDITP
jgi:anti-sigma B factor antagonist